MNTKLNLFGVALVAASGFAHNAANAQVPTNFTGVTTTVYDSNAVAPGYIFVASCGHQGDAGPFFLQIMNNDGTTHAFKKAGYLAPGDNFYPYDFKVLADGRLLNAQYTGWFSYAGSGTVIDQILDENLNVVESVQMGNAYQAQSDDFELLPNGHLLMLGYYSTLADIRSVVPAASPRAEISGAVIQELDGNRNVVWQWRTWDHFNWNEFADWGAVSNSGVIAAWPVNAVRLDPIDGQLLVATTGEQMKINRQTGDVMWRLGGAFNQFTFVGVTPQEAIRQLAGHDFHRLANGNYIVFNNGTADASRTSQVHEYQLDEVRKIATHVWQYLPSTTIATSSRGNAQRLPNGNTLIGWGSSAGGQPHPDCTEVTSSGAKVFELSFTNASVDSYRAFRFVYPPAVQRLAATVHGLSFVNTYDFTGTGVRLDLSAVVGDAYNSASAAREPYAPLNPLFQGKAPRLLPWRVSLSQTFINGIEGVISFDAAGFAIPDPTNTTVYYRTTEGQGVFVALPSQYNFLTGQLQAQLSDTGFGEYAFGVPDVAEVAFPPLQVEPESLQSTGFVTRVPPLVQAGRSYTVNQQLPIALSWCPKGFAAGYALQISTNQSFASLTIDVPYQAEAHYTFSNALPGRTYYWRVSSYNDGGVSDWATNSFATVPPMVQVLAPNGGENWRRGQAYFLQWNDNLLENAVLELYQGASLASAVATVSGTVSYKWLIPADLPPGRDYSLKVRSATNATLYDLSDQPFSIVDSPVINPRSIVRLADGRMRFDFTAPGASQITVLSSTNLTSWQPLQTLPLATDSATFTEATASTGPARFYRLAVP
jgi:hypothetical protein